MGEPRFIADAMLGDLARWLRMLGYDTIYAGNREDWWVLRQLDKEPDRILLTKDRGLCRRARRRGRRCIFIDGSSVEEYLLEVAKGTGIRLGIDPDRSRCPACNGELARMYKPDIKGLVPQRVYEAYDEFWRCIRCGKVYWRGSHWRGIEETLIRVRSRLEEEG